MNTANSKSESHMEIYQQYQIDGGYRTIREQLLNWGEDPKYTEIEFSNDSNKEEKAKEDDLIDC